MQAQGQLNYKAQIFYLINHSEWNKVKEEVKRLYQLIKPVLTEDNQNDLLIEIYNNIICDSGLCSFWRYMNN